MLQWLLAIVAVLAVGGAVTWLAHGPLRRRDEAAAGIAALSALSWRQFIRTVLEALSLRGYERLVDHDAAAGDGDFTLVRDGGHWLLSAKHGSAFVLGRSSVAELAGAMGVSGAAGGLLVTQGRIDDDAHRAARGHPIELLDGATLWPELRPLLPADLVAPIAISAAKRARERSWAGWLLALIAGVAVSTLAFDRPTAAPTPAPTPTVTATPAAALPAPASRPAAEADPQAPASAAAFPDDATLETQRHELASVVATLPMVSRALWTSTSTLEVFVNDSGDDPVDAICPLVERYPALASSRIQLTPPAESGRPVRFRQCRSY